MTTLLNWLRTTCARRLPGRRALRARGRAFERLEGRELLDGAGRASGLTWADTSQLTLSFANDSTDIAGEPSQLFERFGTLGRPAEWQNAILLGFQTWLRSTGSNVGVVSDVGSLPFGTPGPRTGDHRFGDIRVGARPLSDDVMAIAVAHDTVVSGTWGGDLIFNSDADFASLADLFAVAVHEAGHVFGLEHSDDPQSPMHVHGISPKTSPTPQDLADIQRQHGQRVPDSNEGPHGNETPRTATPLELSLNPALDVSAKTHLVYGDITTSDDVDVFSLSLPTRTRGAITVRLQSRQISLLAPSLRISTVDGTEIARTESRRVGGATVEILIDDPVPGGTYLIEVRAARGTAFDVGGYSLITRFEGDFGVPIAEETLDLLTVARERKITQRDLQALLADREYLLDARENDVDSILAAVNLPPQVGFELYSHYEALGAISSARDVDYFFFTAADADDSVSPYLHLTVRPLELAGLIPSVSVLDRRGNEIHATLLVNGGGEVVLQAPAIPGERYYIRVKAASDNGLFDRGNYRVSLTFVETALEPVTFAQGHWPAVTEAPSANPPPSTGRPTGSKEDSHRDVVPALNDSDATAAPSGYVLYVATPQLFHFILQAGPAQAEGYELVLASLFDATDRLVHTMSAPAGETRTTHSVLLLPGTYRMRFDSITLGSLRSKPLSFRLLGLSVSDPFAVDPDDPSYDPFFECPGSDPLFCYPGGIISEDPFLWQDFLDSLPSVPDLDLPELISELLGSWWYWYWDQQGTQFPPLAIDDGYLAASGVTLVVDAAYGVLANDFFDPAAHVTASLYDDVEVGMLTVQDDGGFSYQPPPGFSGDVRFYYQAFALQQASPIATVTIRVLPEETLPGDFDGSDAVDVEDIDLLCEAIRFDDDSAIFDLNLDGFVNSRDWQMMLALILGTTAGDANLDGRFNSEDLVAVFLVNEYEDGVVGNSSWATGDWNCDGEFTSDDLIAALQAGSYVAEAVGLVTPTTIPRPTEVAARLAADRVGNDRVRPIAAHSAHAGPELPARPRHLLRQFR